MKKTPTSWIKSKAAAEAPAADEPDKADPDAGPTPSFSGEEVLVSDKYIHKAKIR